MKNESKNILVVGLGLLGMSMAMAFRRASVRVLGYNRNREAVDYGIREGILCPESENEKQIFKEIMSFFRIGMNERKNMNIIFAE